MATDNSQPSKRAQMIGILRRVKRYGKKVIKNNVGLSTYLEMTFGKDWDLEIASYNFREISQGVNSEGLWDPELLKERKKNRNKRFNTTRAIKTVQNSFNKFKTTQKSPNGKRVPLSPVDRVKRIMKRLRTLQTTQSNLYKASIKVKGTSSPKGVGKGMSPNQARLAQIERAKKSVNRQQKRLMDNYARILRQQRIKTKRMIREHGQDFEGNLTAEQNELVRLNGDDYKGKYHRFEDGTVFAGSKPGLFRQEELVPKSVFEENQEIFRAIKDKLDEDSGRQV